MGDNVTRKILGTHLVDGRMTPGEEIGIKIDEILILSHDFGHEARRTILIEAGDHDFVEQRLAAEIEERAFERMLAVDLHVAVGAE